MFSYNLLKDLNNLYCRTGNKEIEDIFIKFAQDSESSFVDWISKNNHNKVLINGITNKQVLHALAYLETLNKRVSPDNVLAFLLSSPNSEYLPIYRSFLNLMSSDLRGILYPFSNILTAFQGIRPNEGWLTDEEVSADLRVISDHYNEFVQRSLNKPFESEQAPHKRKRAPTKKERTQSLFSYLLRSFSQDILEVIDKYPEEEMLAKSIRAGNLPNGMLIVPYLKHIPQSTTLAPVKKIVKNAISKVGSGNYSAIFNEIRNDIMSSLSFMTTEESNVYKMKQENFSRFVDEDEEDFPIFDQAEEEKKEQEKYPFHPELIKHEAYIYLVSAVLYQIYLKTQ